MGRRLNPGHPWWRLNRHRRNPDAPARVASIPISNDASFVSAPPLFLSSLPLLSSSQVAHTLHRFFATRLHRSIQHSWSHSSLHLVALALLYTWSHFPNFLFQISSTFLHTFFQISSTFLHIFFHISSKVSSTFLPDFFQVGVLSSIAKSPTILSPPSSNLW